MFLYRAEPEKGKDDPIELESGFMPTGFPKFNGPIQYNSSEVKWYPGDLLVLYSDGITEAFNPDTEMYGAERFKALISENRHLTPAEIKAEILNDLRAYQRGESTSDDITLVVAKFM